MRNEITLNYTMERLTNAEIKRLTELRHELHRLAEVSGEEKKTADRIRSFLKGCSPDEIISGIGGHGLVATFKGEKSEAPSVMIRCELDALPIEDENDIDYRSDTEGVGHKCGHDGHMAIVAGVGLQLNNHGAPEGDVHLLFQPSEETGQGAERVLGDEKFRKLDPDFIFALHNLPGFPGHQIILKDGTFAAASRGFIGKLTGATSHAAHPEQGKSPALALAQLIQTFSSFPQFFAGLDQAAKVTVIHSRLGEIAFGTSPGEAELMATLRTYDSELMERLCRRMEQMAGDIARSYGLDIDIEWTEIFEATVNDTGCVKAIEKAAKSNGLDIHRKQTPFSWSEDFGRFTSTYKGAIFGLGAGEHQPHLHASTYDFPDELIATGTDMFLEIINRIT